MTEPKLDFPPIPRGPVNALKQGKEIALADWVRKNAEKHEAERIPYGSMADRAQTALGFTISRGNIEGMYKTLGIPAPCRRRPKPEIDKVKALLRLMGVVMNETARQARQNPSDEFVKAMDEVKQMEAEK